MYQKGGKLFDVPLEVVKAPYKDGNITTYLHKPFGVEKPPLVIWCGGVDQYKANHWRPIQDMLAKGFAVATLDLPGFGESRQWPRDHQCRTPISPSCETYLKREDIDTTRISFFGQSYGGEATLSAALRNDPRVKAIVAMCAGLHLGMKNSLAPEAKPGDKLINGPLLVVNGTRDAWQPRPGPDVDLPVGEGGRSVAARPRRALRGGVLASRDPTNGRLAEGEDQSVTGFIVRG